MGLDSTGFKLSLENADSGKGGTVGVEEGFRGRLRFGGGKGSAGGGVQLFQSWSLHS